MVLAAAESSPTVRAARLRLANEELELKNSGASFLLRLDVEADFGFGRDQTFHETDLAPISRARLGWTETL